MKIPDSKPFLTYRDANLPSAVHTVNLGNHDVAVCGEFRRGARLSSRPFAQVTCADCAMDMMLGAPAAPGGVGDGTVAVRPDLAEGSDLE